MTTHSTLNMVHHPLDRYTEAVRDDQPDAEQSDRAQRRLMARMDKARRSQRNTAPIRRWATAAALALLLVPVLLMMPGTNGSVAFAEVQSYFTDFQTMKARLTTQMNGNTVLEMDIEVDERDRARLDAGDAFTFIIDPNRQVMLQLFHQPRRAVRVPLDGEEGPDQTSEALDWLAQIREYQGQSRLTDEVRTIDGADVYGFRLTDQSIDMTLWATESGRPVLLEMATGPEAASAITRIEFEFDQPIEQGRFDLTVPRGYSATAEVEDN